MQPLHQPLVDEVRWLEEEVARYRTMTVAERTAIFRDLIDCMVALMGDRLREARDGEPPVMTLWYQPSLLDLHGADRRTAA